MSQATMTLLANLSPVLMFNRTKIIAGKRLPYALHPSALGRMAPPLEMDSTRPPSLPVPYPLDSSMPQSLVASYEPEFTSNPDQM